MLCFSLSVRVGRFPLLSWKFPYSLNHWILNIMSAISPGAVWLCKLGYLALTDQIPWLKPGLKELRNVQNKAFYNISVLSVHLFGEPGFPVCAVISGKALELRPGFPWALTGYITFTSLHLKKACVRNPFGKCWFMNKPCWTSWWICSCLP